MGFIDLLAFVMSSDDFIGIHILNIRILKVYILWFFTISIINMVIHLLKALKFAILHHFEEFNDLLAALMSSDDVIELNLLNIKMLQVCIS